MRAALVAGTVDQLSLHTGISTGPQKHGREAAVTLANSGRSVTKAKRKRDCGLSWLRKTQICLLYILLATGGIAGSENTAAVHTCVLCALV